MNYLLDTNLIVIYSRDSKTATRIETQYELFSDVNTLAVSVVTLGEIDALVKKLGLGEKRKSKISNLVSRLAVIRIDAQEIVNCYGSIDAYSQGKLKEKKGDFTARNMGKNDIWIAATASVYDLTLVTTDKDFDHLRNEYVKLKLIDLEEFR